MHDVADNLLATCNQLGQFTPFRADLNCRSEVETAAHFSEHACVNLVDPGEKASCTSKLPRTPRITLAKVVPAWLNV